jgi:hypothetical protein
MSRETKNRIAAKERKDRKEKQKPRMDTNERE